MKIRDLAATLLTVILTLGVSQAVHADPDRPGPPDPKEHCDLPKRHESLINHICVIALLEVFNTIEDASNVNVNARDKSTLQSKVCDADDKLEVIPTPDRKFDDAVQKLTDVINAVDTKAKIIDVNNDIKNAAQCAIDCINGRGIPECLPPDP